MKVLAADDNPVFRSMLRTMLAKWGYDATICRDGKAAWDAMQSPDAPRLLLLEWMMPGLDGVELCRRIRVERPEHYVYIIMLTVKTKPGDLIEAMDAGCDELYHQAV